MYAHKYVQYIGLGLYKRHCHIRVYTVTDESIKLDLFTLHITVLLVKAIHEIGLA